MNKLKNYKYSILGGILLVIFLLCAAGIFSLGVVLLTASDKAAILAGIKWVRLVLMLLVCYAALYGYRRVRALEKAQKESPAACPYQPVIPVQKPADKPAAPKTPAAPPTPQASEQPLLHLHYVELRPAETFGVRKGFPYDITIAKAVAAFMSEHSFAMCYTRIGGGSDEVRHTGAVAYSAGYTSAQRFIDNAESDYLRADDEAGTEYGSWFTGLNYSYIRQEYVLENITIRIEYTSRITIAWEGEKPAIVEALLDFLTDTGTKE